MQRPVIAPGLHVLSTAPGVLQLGLAPGHRLRVPDTPAVRRTLEILTRGEKLPATRDVQRARSLLEPALRDGDAFTRPGIAAADAAAVALRHPSTAAQRLAARADTRVEVRGDLGADVDALLRAVGLSCAAATGPRTVLLLSRGEPDREPLDALVRSETPHLVVRAVESDLVLGPFVVPGRTACLRCCDLHLDDHEPGYAVLLRETVRARRTDGVPDPVDTAQCWVALGLAVRDLVRYAEGERPDTWSSTLVLDGVSGAAGAAGPAGARLWAPHPDCSCTWTTRGPALARSATMEE